MEKQREHNQKHSLSLVAALLAFAILLGSAPLVAWADVCPGGGDHAYSVELIEYATEDKDGYRQFTCTQCGYQFDQAIPATGHHWGSWIREVEPTCVSEGYEYRVCTTYPDSPHYEERMLPMLSASGQHSFVLVDEVLNTCTETGYRQYACSICGETSAEETPLLGHVWGEWEIERESTTTQEGEKRRVCAHDATHIEYETLPLQEKKEEKVFVEKPAPSCAVDDLEAEKKSPFFDFKFNVVDAVVLTFDFLVVGIFIVFALPFIYQLRWVRKQRAEAHAAFIKRIKEEGVRQ